MRPTPYSTLPVTVRPALAPLYSAARSALLFPAAASPRPPRPLPPAPPAPFPSAHRYPAPRSCVCSIKFDTIFAGAAGTAESYVAMLEDIVQDKELLLGLIVPSWQCHSSLACPHVGLTLQALGCATHSERTAGTSSCPGPSEWLPCSHEARPKSPTLQSPTPRRWRAGSQRFWPQPNSF